MLLALLALAALSPAGPGHDTPIRLRLSDDGNYSPGDRPRVHVKTAKDGYLLVMRMNSDGSARVLFPLTPADEATVDGGRDAEIKGRGAASAGSWAAEGAGGADGSGHHHLVSSVASITAASGSPNSSSAAAVAPMAGTRPPERARMAASKA